MILLTFKVQDVEQSVDEGSERTNTAPALLDRLVELVRLGGVGGGCSDKDISSSPYQYEIMCTPGRSAHQSR